MNLIDEKITGTTENMEYSIDNRVHWTKCNNGYTILSLGIGNHILVREKGNIRNYVDLGSIAVGETGVEASYTITQGSAPVKQIETATVIGGATSNGGLIVSMFGLSWLVPSINAGDSAEQVAEKIVGTFYVPADQRGYDLVASGSKIILTKRVATTNDASLNISIQGNRTGVPNASTSENTQVGIAASTEKATIKFTSGAVADGIIVVTLSDRSYLVQVSSGDTASDVARKVRAVLSSKSVSGYRIGGTETTVDLTSLIEEQDITPDLSYSMNN